MIEIDRSDTDGLHNSSGTFTNSAIVTIGATASTGLYGIWNAATFNNNTGGAIDIAQINIHRFL